jgi:hypothetical protein
MEFKELLARLAAFFTTWNVKYVPANQVNRLQIQLIGTEVHYFLMGKYCAQLRFWKIQKLNKSCGSIPVRRNSKYCSAF